MPDPRHELGRRGEQLAAEHLMQRGFFIRERNWKIQHGRKWWEVDIIAEKKSGIWPFKKTKTVVFVEVKTVRSYAYSQNVQNVQKKESGHFSGHPELQVDMKRQKRLIRAAEMYLTKNKIPIDSNWQIDVIGVIVDSVTNKIELRHTERAVENVLF